MKKYNSIDLFKIIMSIFVVANHTLGLIENENSFIWTILKSAVPFFFLSLGFLLMNKMNSNKDDVNIIIIYLKKILRLYIIWSIIFLPITLYHCFAISEFSFQHNLISITKNYFFKGEQFYSYPLWYLLCTVYSLLFLIILKKIGANKIVISIVSIVLYIIGYIYSMIVLDPCSYTGILYKIIKILTMLFGSSGRLLQGMFYIYLGMLLYEHKEKIMAIKYNVALATLLIVLLITLNYFFNLEILKVLLYISIFILCICINLKDNNIYYCLRKTGVIMYFTHMLFFFIYSLIVGFDNCKGVVGFLVSIICTIILSIIINIINRNKDKKILNVIFN